MADQTDRETSGSSHRATMLTVLLILQVGGGFFLFMSFATFGFFTYVLVIALGLGFLGCLHYLVWGHWFEQAVQEERRAIQEQQAAEEARTSRPWERRF